MKIQANNRLIADPVLLGEPQVVLVTGDVIQISTQREDGWAFGSKVSFLEYAFISIVFKALI